MASVLVLEVGDYVITKDTYGYSSGKYATDKETGEYILDKSMNKSIRSPRYHASLVQALNSIYERMQVDNFEELNNTGNAPGTFLELLETIRNHDEMFKKLVRVSFKK
jgi:hypothetical protein